MDSNKLKKMRVCSHLLPDPGGEVARELIDEAERLQEAVRVAYSELWEALRLANQIPLSANERFFTKMKRIIEGSESV